MQFNRKTATITISRAYMHTASRNIDVKCPSFGGGGGKDSDLSVLQDQRLRPQPSRRTSWKLVGN